VGDKDFQAKSFDKILSLKKEGRTFLFTSHSAASVQQLADRALWLEQGGLKDSGLPAAVLSAYEKSVPSRHLIISQK
jgi:ABC-type polysaccharide/polyol phosphate transport system ATPase subunit